MEPATNNEERSEAISANNVTDSIPENPENESNNEESESSERVEETGVANETLDEGEVTEAEGSSARNAETGEANETSKTENQSLVNSERPSYVNARNRGSFNYEKIERKIEEEFPEDFMTTQVPTLKELIHVGEAPATHYKQGDWVEVRGPDMVWRLDRITRVVKIAPDDWDWNDPLNEGKDPTWIFSYHAGNTRDICEKDLRAPEEGLLHVFGSRPWVWQQWACIKLENALRFQRGHENDFMTMDVQKYVAELWEQWMNHPSNADFKTVFQDERIGDFGRAELVGHIMKPFELIDEIKEDKEKWNFIEDNNMSVYTYLSLFGSGWIVPVVMAAIQIAIPILLLRTSDLRDKNFSNAFRVRDHEQNEDLDNIQGMAITVLILYLFRVVPETIVNFFRAVGPSGSAYSRIMSLREKLWVQQEDRVGQMIGYKADIFMNTFFVCFLYGVNVFIIVNTSDALDVILNSLAFEFVLKLDEEVVSSSWWDPHRRWLTAGSIEVIIQYTLETRFLKSATHFWRKYDIPLGRKSLVQNDIGGSNFLKDTRCASRDSEDAKFMTEDEKKIFDFAYVAKKNGHKHAISEYSKGTVHFDRTFNFILTFFFAAGDGGMFNRFSSYRTWSRWEKVLFVSDIPEMSSVFAADGSGLSDALDNVKHSDGNEFANFSSIDIEDDKNFKLELFWRHGIDILTFRYMFDGIKRAWERKDFFRLFFNPFADFTLWLAYAAQIIFPFYFCAVFVAVFIDVVTDSS
eukprot:CAMPEP_0185735410 /NCGR_PEP_ID=MMETSP1171-20130828/25212_1 /TAXON_ID=374046 /ORGANISM="Helicotheca tamensis, Strain CCMP826" /LENGTH=746 /DNA_ID=CAMNT_0028405709 /DNA_START=1 /DNA_END=2241 /DNA_ORIENTATION=+